MNIRNIPPIMSRKEVQEILRIGKNNVLKLIHSGELEAFVINRSYRITRESLWEYIQNNYYIPGKENIK